MQLGNCGEEMLHLVSFCVVLVVVGCLFVVRAVGSLMRGFFPMSPCSVIFDFPQWLLELRSATSTLISLTFGTLISLTSLISLVIF